MMFKLQIPGSKSISHRFLAASALARGNSVLSNVLRCEDTSFTMDALRALGVSISDRGAVIRVSGSAGGFTAPEKETRLFIGNSGTSLRLLVSVAALTEGAVLLTGTDRMKQRPIGPLVEALRTLGAQIEYTGAEGCPPVLVKSSSIHGGEISIPANESSQYVSSILLCAPYAASDVVIHVDDPPVSRAYIDLTLEAMETFGVGVDRDGYRTFRVPSGTCFGARNTSVQPDISSASYFWAAAAVTGETVVTENTDVSCTHQGDAGFLDLLEAAGCRVSRQKGSVIVHGGSLKAIDADMSAMPDMVPTLAAVALFCPGTSRMRNILHLRYKESDRIAVIAREWSRMGAHVEERKDELIIRGGVPLKTACIDPHNDHRIAMSAAVAGLRVPLRIKNPACVEKSFPDFWKLWGDLRLYLMENGGF
ncbi:MAG TPA: 3-phosphoshikimate 1-carboxyvinyltransferase [Desulfobacteraceae bacterium]|nr:3-phosphoshikimate 1-carboxyvinyltransferase [Desulfobacteraceae bacterium]